MLGLSRSVLVKQGWNAFLCDEMHSPGINCILSGMAGKIYVSCRMASLKDLE